MRVFSQFKFFILLMLTNKLNQENRMENGQEIDFQSQDQQ